MESRTTKERERDEQRALWLKVWDGITSERTREMMSSRERDKVKLTLQSGLVVKGEMRAAPADLSSLLVTNLETPLGSVPRAKLRGTDVLAVEL